MNATISKYKVFYLTSTWNWRASSTEEKRKENNSVDSAYYWYER